MIFGEDFCLSADIALTAELVGRRSNRVRTFPKFTRSLALCSGEPHQLIGIYLNAFVPAAK